MLESVCVRVHADLSDSVGEPAMLGILFNSSLCFRRKFLCCRAMASMIFLFFSAASWALALVSGGCSGAGSAELGLSMASADEGEYHFKPRTTHCLTPILFPLPLVPSLPSTPHLSSPPLPSPSCPFPPLPSPSPLLPSLPSFSPSHLPHPQVSPSVASGPPAAAE